MNLSSLGSFGSLATSALDTARSTFKGLADAAVATGETGAPATGDRATRGSGTGPSSTGPSSTGPSSAGPSSSGTSSAGRSSDGSSPTGASSAAAAKRTDRAAAQPEVETADPAEAKTTGRRSGTLLDSYA